VAALTVDTSPWVEIDNRPQNSIRDETTSYEMNLAVFSKVETELSSTTHNVSSTYHTPCDTTRKSSIDSILIGKDETTTIEIVQGVRFYLYNGIRAA